ncbi:MAG: TonB family protein [Prevotella sp.]|nr:TonB family protein [Prevotella sp.]
MEVKKSPRVDLERRRAVGFLLGFILSAALFFVVLEFNSTSFNVTADDLLNELDDESELISLPKLPEQLVMKAPDVAEQEPEKLNVVETAMEQPELAELNPKDQVQPLDGSLEKRIEELLKDEIEIAPPDNAPTVDPDHLRVVEDLPQYPGGPVEFLKWLTANLKYPPAAQQARVEGKVVAQFIVNEDGSITDLKLTKKLHPQCDAEALRVLRSMPRWTPGIQNDKPCRTRVCIPIVFKL